MAELTLTELLGALEFPEEQLAKAALTQGRLYMHAAKYYTRAMAKRKEAEAAYEERKSSRAQFLRGVLRKKFIKSSRKMKEATEGEIKEKVMLSSSVVNLRRAYDEAVVLESYAKELLEAYRWRGAACRILAGLISEEGRQELRIFEHKKFKDKLTQRWPKGE